MGLVITATTLTPLRALVGFRLSTGMSFFRSSSVSSLMSSELPGILPRLYFLVIWNFAFSTSSPVGSSFSSNRQMISRSGCKSSHRGNRFIKKIIAVCLRRWEASYRHEP